MQSFRLPRFRVDFAAKVRWRMRFDRRRLWVTLQDKFAVREFAATRCVATPQLFHVTDDAADIPFDRLPPKCVIKANHGWNWNLLRIDGEIHPFGDGRSWIGEDGLLLERRARPPGLTDVEAAGQCATWLGQTFSQREWAYGHIPPRILVEAWIEPRTGRDLFDYRFYAFNGEVKAIGVGSSAYRRDGVNAFFYPDWREIPLTRYAEARADPPPPRPSTLEEMLRVARRLSEGIDFVRVDLYDSTEGILLGEMTVYPQAGRKKTPTACRVFNQWLSDQWSLSTRDAFVAYAFDRLRRWRRGRSSRHRARPSTRAGVSG